MRRLLLALCIGLLLAGCGRAGPPVRSRPQPAQVVEPTEQDPDEERKETSP